MSETNGGVGGEACGLCGRGVQELTRHHLVPRTRHKNIKNKRSKRSNRAPDRQALLQTVGLCAPCHRHIHATIPNKELEREYNTLEALKAHPDIGKFVEWIRRKPHGTTAARIRHRAG